MESIEIKTIAAGNIGEAGYAWKRESETLYYGKDGAGAISSWEAVIPGDSTSRGIEYNLLQAICTPGGAQLILVERTASTTSTRNIRVYKRDVNNTVSYASLYTGALGTVRSKGTILPISDGGYLAIFSKVDTNNQVNVEVHHSQDGENWFLRSRRGIPIDIDGAGTFGAGATGVRIERIRAIESLGQILLLMNITAYNTS